MADWIKVLSPGEHVVSTFPGSSYVGGIGTSQSTALVSGAVQVVRDIYRDGSPAFVEKVLIDTGFVIPDDRVDTEGRPNGLSAARVDFGGIARRWEGDYIRAHPKDVIVLPAVQKKW
jgi:subtilisin family serine protease